MRWLIIFLFVSSHMLFAGGVKGVVKDEKGEPLAFTTIFVKQTGSGTTTNINGDYEIALAPGPYDIVFQYVGYETITMSVNVGAGVEVINVTLKTQATMLQTVTVKAGKEDPAYTIMRKAIAKATYHRNQLDAYSARVYIKGSGKLKDYPWLAKRQIEKSGFEKGQVYTTESVSEVKYTRPNKFDERVISIRSDGNNNNTSPNQYIFGSFYEPEVAETISPLSPKSFSYYRFEYQGTFKDRDYEVSRIKVIPRVKGDNVVEGMLYIVENWWSIHSMEVKTTKLGIGIFIKAVYAPIEDKAWLPVSHQFSVNGKIFGFEFEYKYLATVSDYKIQLNPELYVEPEKMEVIDEKIEKEEAKQIQQQQKGKTKAEEKATQLQERLESGKEITRKELRQVMKEYEKQELKQQENPEVLFDNNFTIDSAAHKSDSAYWAAIRPVPLTQEEIRGYRKWDSLMVESKKKMDGDTLKQSKHKGFQPWDILLGDNYSIGKHSNIKIHTPFGGFNTVEGWNLFYKVSYGVIFQDTLKTQFTVTPTFRYAFARERGSGNLRMTLRNKSYQVTAEGGRYVQQLNHDKPIHPVVNTLTTLLLERNLMKIYERDYLDVTLRRRFSEYLTVHTDWSWSRRYQLGNNTNYKWVDRNSIEGYTSNIPVNEEMGSTKFPTHDALVGAIGLQARPWLKFRIRNGQRSEIHGSSPTLTADYRKGFDGLTFSDVKFDHIELGIRHNFNWGVRANIDISVKAGMFLNNDSMAFIDYKHFLGNQTPIITTDPVGSFRLLDYYRFSTSDKYVSANVHYQFRRFLVTSFPLIRMMGVRENMFINYLATPASKNYTEVGYSIDGILRIFRLEGAASFIDGKYMDYGFRIGIATYIGLNFVD